MSLSSSLPSGDEIEVSGEFLAAFNLMEDTNQNCFTTGKAGTGKSTLLRYFVENTTKHVAVVAPTGIAALNVQGETIHSFFWLPPVVITDKEINAHTGKPGVYRRLDALIIDEVSMVRADLFDAVDKLLRKHLDSNRPFGGMQILLFGDPLQLPPVYRSDSAIGEYLIKNYEKPFFFFNAHAYKPGGFKEVELTRVYRQNDLEFIELLDAVRTNSLTQEQRNTLNSRVVYGYTPLEGSPVVTVTSTNRQSDEINDDKMRALSLPEFTYQCAVTGKFTKESKRTPAPRLLRLRKGAQVMFVRNSVKNDKGTWDWVNGTLGVVQDIDTTGIHVEVKYDDHSYVYNVPKMEWDIREHIFDAKTNKIRNISVGTFVQYPLQPAWAVTIHKSQGLTLPEVIIDVGNGAFAHGQVYVALSRCPTLEGITLLTPLSKRDVKVESAVVDFYNRIRETGVYSLERSKNKNMVV